MNQAQFQSNLTKYAEVLVKVGLNIQPGQRLLIGCQAPYEDSAPLIYKVTEAAYKAGAELVDVLVRDVEMTKLRLTHADIETMDAVSQWPIEARRENGERQDAILGIIGGDPAALAGFDPQKIQRMQIAGAKAAEPVRHYISAALVNWCGGAIASPAWANVVFPDLPESERVPALWDAIFKMTRADQDDPIAAWETHRSQLKARRAYLNAKQYDKLHYSAPGTDLEVGLVENHRWLGGEGKRPDGLGFVPNIPTEEVFTMPHSQRTSGTVTASMPLSLTGNVVVGIQMTFENGKIVQAEADQGEEILNNTLDIDEGARHLGEVALVPNSSPISNFGRLFYNTLYDENASSHLAFGQAYANTIEGGNEMERDALNAAGGNQSMIHVDFMIGSGDMNIDGITADGTREPVMRNGEWAFDV